MLPQYLVCKYELNCEYCNITLARNKAPWWWPDKIETYRSVLKCFMWNYMCIHWLINWSDIYIYIYIFLIIEASRSPSDISHTVGLLWTSEQSDAERTLPDNTIHSQERDIHAPGGIRTHNSSKRAVADPRLRPRGHWDRLCLHIHNSRYQPISTFFISEANNDIGRV